MPAPEQLRSTPGVLHREAFRMSELPGVLGLSLDTVRRLINRGEIRANRVSHNIVLIPASEVARFIAGEPHTDVETDTDSVSVSQ